MTKSIIIISLFLAILISGCSNDEEQPIGIWDDIIKLSTKEAYFDADEDSIIITTQGTWWWITHITLNEEVILHIDPSLADKTKYTLSGEEFVLERRNANTLFVKMNNNPLSIDRELVISLQAGDYFDHIEIHQRANNGE